MEEEEEDGKSDNGRSEALSLILYSVSVSLIKFFTSLARPELRFIYNEYFLHN